MPEQIRTTEKKKFIYDTEFKEWINKNPGIIKSFKEFLKQFYSTPDGDLHAGLVFQVNDLRVELLKRSNREGGLNLFSTFKITVDGISFFVKAEKEQDVSQGFEEFRSTRIAKGILQNIPWVEVIESQLGYQDSEGRSYFVSKWRDLKTVQEVLLSGEAGADEHFDLRNKISEIRRLLSKLEFFDVDKKNMFYDPATKKIILYDLDSLDQKVGV